MRDSKVDARCPVMPARTRRLLVCLAALGPALPLLVACSAPDSPLGAERAALATPFANDQPAYDYFVGKGLTNFQSAGIVGNLDQESGVNPAVSQSGGGVGRGIAQWSAGGRWDTAKGDNVLEFATQKGQDPMSLALQLDFIWYELQSFPEYGLAKLQATTNVSDASTVFEDNYEGCVAANFPECAQESRITYAKGVLAAYGADPVSSGGGGAGGAGAFAGSGGASAGVSGGAGAAGRAGAGGAGGGVAGASASAGSSSGGNAAVGGGSAAAGTAGILPGSSSSSSSCAFNRARKAPLGAPFMLTLAALALTVRRRRRA